MAIVPTASGRRARPQPPSACSPPYALVAGRAPW